MVCPLDGQPVLEAVKGRKEVATQPAANQAHFDLKLISPISMAGTYRVFIERSDLFFIQIESGSKSFLAALAPLLGPVGGLIPLGLWLFTKNKAKSRLETVQQQKPEDLLREKEGDFKLYLAEIREAAIEPAAWLANSGKAGRLILTVRHGEKIKFEFADAGEIAGAIRLLAPLLNSTLKNNVEWNQEKRRVQRKKTI